MTLSCGYPVEINAPENPGNTEISVPYSIFALRLSLSGQ